MGADRLTLTSRPGGSGDVVIVGAGESTSTPADNESNLDHISGFSFSLDKLVLAGHSAASGAVITTHQDAAVTSGEAQAYAAAALYAFGNDFHASHFGGATYLLVQESYPGADTLYLFGVDHTAVAFIGASLANFQPGAIIGG